MLHQTPDHYVTICASSTQDRKEETLECPVDPLCSNRIQLLSQRNAEAPSITSQVSFQTRSTVKHDGLQTILSRNARFGECAALAPGETSRQWA